MSPTPTTKPTILIVPGAWHPPSSFAPTTHLLTAAGYPCIPVTLPCYNASPPLKDFQPDIEVIRSAVRGEVDEGRDVVVVMHSYGSVPGGEAVKGLGHGKGRVLGLVYVSAFVPPVGSSLMAMLGGQDLPWFIVSPDKQTVMPSDPRSVFYADVPSDLAAANEAALKHHSYQTFFSETTWAPWEEIPCSYVFCTEDKAVPLAVQRGMVEATGVKWSETVIEGASHSPFLSREGELAGAIRRAAGEVL